MNSILNFLLIGSSKSQWTFNVPNRLYTAKGDTKYTFLEVKICLLAIMVLFMV